MKLKKGYFKFLLLSSLFVGQHSFAQQVSQETMQQIQSLIKEKNSRTPVQQKIDSRLLQAIRENRGEKMVANINLVPANVDADASGVLKVDINGNITSELLSKITSLGGTIIYPSAKYHTVRASVSLKSVEAIAAYKEVTFIQPAVKAMLVDADRTDFTLTPTEKMRVEKLRTQLTSYLNMHPLAGKVTSEGDATHRADDVRSTFGYQGQGVKIGVISDSYNAKNKAATDVSTGDLPGVGNPDGDTTPVTVVQDFPSGSDEGRAMLQVIHDLAPKAQLFFATADISEAGFADNIETLRNTYHCDIICDDVAYFDEPAFQDGIVAQAVDAVTADGALYFSSAGNSGSLAKGTSGVFEGDFNDAGSPPFTGGTKSGTIHNFGTVASPLNGDIVTASGIVYNLTWSDLYGASANDYDLFLVSSAGTVKSSSTNVQTGTQNPYEQLSASISSGDRLVVFKTAGAAVRAFHLNTNRGTLSIGTNGQTHGHASAAYAFCMAATPASTAFQSGYPTGPYPNEFVSTNKAEPFSSDGPRRKFYNPDGSVISPGKFTFASNGGTVFAKPDLTAADGVKTTFTRLSGLSPFFGTSCAAPHAGAIAALLLSANHSLTAAQVRSLLTSTALDIESSGYDNVSGYGIIQAFQAASSVTTTSCNSQYDGSSHNTFATAVTIPLNTAINGKISSATDSDFYKFTTPVKGQGSIKLTTLPADYDMYIYNAAQKLVASSKKRGTTSESLSGNLPKGTFYVKVVGFNGAFNTSSCYTLTVTQASGLIASTDESDAANMSITKTDFQLYPNPVSSMLTVSTPKFTAGTVIRISDAFGKTLVSKTVTSTSSSINVSALTNGLYILNVVDKNGKVINTSKFEKQ